MHMTRLLLVNICNLKAQSGVASGISSSVRGSVKAMTDAVYFASILSVRVARLRWRVMLSKSLHRREHLTKLG